VGAKSPPTRRELREYLLSQLPEYMAPSLIVYLDTLPLTPTGKVNKRELPSPEEVGQAQEHVYVPPRSLTEELLTDIWSDILGVEKISVNAGFLELGGDSLHAARIIERVLQVFKQKIPHEVLFQEISIAELAEIIKQKQYQILGNEQIEQIVDGIEKLSDEEVESRNELHRNSYYLSSDSHE
jgi:acyl carrier protein